MIKTHIKKVASLAAVIAISATTLGNALAATTIGTGSVTGSSALDQPIVWDDSYGTDGNATATVTGIIVTAKVEPTLNVSFSTDEIALGLLTPGTPSTGTLNIEVGTNASRGVKITMTSANGGLLHSGSTDLINDDESDGEAYSFSSSVANDSTITTGLVKTPLSSVQSDTANITTEHEVYKTNKAEITEGTNDAVLTVSATANATTAAGDYKDTLTFTVSGNF